MSKIFLLILGLGAIALILFFFISRHWMPALPLLQNGNDISKRGNELILNPLAIESLRKRQYPGSNLVIEQTFDPGANYDRYIASYQSDGLKIYGLLTVPREDKPTSGWPASNASQRDAGWPVIIFNHGYIPPKEYRTTQRYVAYVDAFARHGYIVFKPDYRGHGSSEGEPEGAYYFPAYTVDVLNALSSVKRYKDADPDRIGMWGHSMGGSITLRSLTVRPADIKAAVIWGGVVGTYDDLMNRWHRRVAFTPGPTEMVLRNRYRSNLITRYGTPQTNPDFWDSLDPNFFLADITAPVELHAGGADEEVPSEFSQGLYDRLKTLGKTVEFYTYPGDNHNISGSFATAMERSVVFFDKYLKTSPSPGI